MKLHLTSKIPPSVNHYLGYRGIMKNGKPMAVSYKTQEATAYSESFSEYVKAEVAKQQWSLDVNPATHFYVDTVFYFDKLDRDCNNYFKVMLDAITDTGLIWKDDNVVCERVQRIYYDAKNPRIELVIYPVDYIGIFDDASQLDQFRSRCFECKRYKRNCSILRRAIDGRIQSEIEDHICSKFNQVKKNVDRH